MRQFRISGIAFADDISFAADDYATILAGTSGFSKPADVTPATFFPDVPNLRRLVFIPLRVRLFGGFYVVGDVLFSGVAGGFLTLADVERRL